VENLLIVLALSPYKTGKTGKTGKKRPAVSLISGKNHVIIALPPIKTGKTGKTGKGMRSVSIISLPLPAGVKIFASS
jgi:hypothetical protein